ncbi:ABC1 kinase family protein [Leptolyngbya sp. PCC 6406]|uniref:ABC1 kinase family protein n=1 Tax=Leptolyngbya sp. PCC 6406 TaxID=1173264 RepID=UPI0002ACE4AE|nr:AarF/ABC1/UbiB kinase family protein [Leptolyngbya sp. PCC 6406]
MSALSKDSSVFLSASPDHGTGADAVENHGAGDLTPAPKGTIVLVDAISSPPSEEPPLPPAVPKESLPTHNAKAYRWSRRRYSRSRRTIDIWSFVLRLLGARWLYGKAWSYGGTITPEKQAQRRRQQAVWIRETLLDLGPTFIKVGQLFSTRADLFPAEYVEELSKLQDRVPAFSYEQAQEIVEADLGKRIPDLFRSFDPIPLAAASLGQVHRAQLHSGEEVVVKVQRPSLKKLFEIDLSILKGITHYFQNHPDWGKGRDWLGIYDECCRILWEEIDYLNEGRNADTFRRNFRGQDWVKVPRVYWRYASPRVLTLEYLPGIKISHYEALEASGLDRKRLANLGARAYLHQLLNDGFFHADPHPGNIAVSAEGALIFYDFGMMGQVQPATRDRLMVTFMGVAQRDAGLVVASLVDLGALVEVDDMGPVRRSIQYILDNFMDQPFEEQSVTAIGDDLYAIAYDQPFRFPATFTFVMRAFSTLEGVGKGLDPDFNFMEAAKPFAAQLMSNGNSPNSTDTLFGELGRQAAQMSSTALGLPRRLEDTLDKLERGDIRVRVRSIETDRILRRVSGVNMATNYTLLVGAFLLSATILLVYEYLWLAIAAAAVATVAGFALVRLLLRIGRADRLP